MLSLEAEDIWAEVTKACEYREKHLLEVKEMVKKYPGPFYNAENEEYYPENHYFEYASLMLPRLIYNNPRWRVQTRRPGAQRDVAQAIEAGMNRWSVDSNMREPLSEIALDMFFCWGVGLVTLEVMPGQEGVDPEAQTLWPKISRVSFKDFYMDPLAHTEELARYKGHRWVIDKEDLIEIAKAKPDEGWILENIEALTEGAGVEDLDRDRNLATLNRGEVVCHSLWIPEQQLEGYDETDGYHGQILTFAEHMQGNGKARLSFLREPQPYYGPRWGPYTVFGAYNVPDQPYPLGPFVATEGQIRDLNEQAQAMNMSAARYKRLVMVDAASQNLVQDVHEQGDGFVVGVHRFDRSKVAEVSVGGITNEELGQLQVARDRLDRNTGMHDVQRGSVSGGATATEVTVADEASSARLAGIRYRFSAGVAQLGRTCGWYLYHEDRIVFPMGDMDPSEGIPMPPRARPDADPWFLGGVHSVMSGATFDDLELEIEVYSMERTSEGLQQQRVDTMLALVMQIAPMIPQMPWVKWPEILKRLGESRNVFGLENVIDVQMALEFAGLQSEPEQPQPMTMKQAGVTGALPPGALNQSATTRAADALRSAPKQASGFGSIFSRGAGPEPNLN